MNRIMVTFLFCLVMSSNAIAGDDATVQRVTDVVKAYAGSIGCLMRFDPQNIVEYDVDNDGQKEIVVLFGVDPGCSGGSAMYHTALAVIECDTKGRLFVRTSQSFPKTQPEGLPQYTERIFLRSGQLMFSGKAFDFSKDALCCPSVLVEGLLILRNGTWIVEKTQGKSK